MTKKTMRKTASLKQTENAFKGERFASKLVKHLEKVGQIPDTDKMVMSEKTIQKTGSVEEMDKRLQSPEAKERLAERLTNHLIRVGQIKVSPEEAKKLSPEGKKALGEYLERTGQIKE